ncbi:MAG: succinylglutamate desuccinylase/aspartoacylase family protein, partial [Chloroflexi bacterium]|nr:succinylglutamate desuccinylase/aspartoacylase family protein [Chloroflexota bacterium]
MTEPQLTPARRFVFEGKSIGPGKRKKIDLQAARHPTGTWVSLPITIFHGAFEGPTVWVSAAVHGDELNGVEIVRRVLGKLSPESMHGTLIAIPVVNVFGFINGSRYLPDGRDLNRSFPGSRRGSLASRTARLFMDTVVKRSSFGIDLHSAT